MQHSENVMQPTSHDENSMPVGTCPCLQTKFTDSYCHACKVHPDSLDLLAPHFLWGGNILTYITERRRHDEHVLVWQVDTALAFRYPYTLTFVFMS